MWGTKIGCVVQDLNCISGRSSVSRARVLGTRGREGGTHRSDHKTHTAILSLERYTGSNPVNSNWGFGEIG